MTATGQRKRIVSLTMGTLGDLKMFLTLNIALKAAGYDVCLAAPENFHAEIRAAGIEPARCGGDFKELMQADGMQRFVRSSISTQLLRLSVLPRDMRKMLKEGMSDAVAAARGADLIITHPIVLNARDIAESMDVPWVQVAPAPVTRTAEVPLCLYPGAYGAAINRLTYSLRNFEALPYLRHMNTLRAGQLGLPPLSLVGAVQNARKRNADVTLYPFGESIFPRPADWSDDARLTGFWFSDEDDAPLPEDLDTFIERGDAPIFLGFGSMPGLDSDRAAMLIEACEALRLRAVVAAGWSGLDDLLRKSSSDRFHVIRYAPYQKLFPKMKAVVHHGGLGTLAQGLRAGRPTLACPITMDQPFWGNRVEAIGVGPAPLPVAEWTPKRLRQALGEVAFVSSYARRAADLAPRFVNENGIGSAVGIISRALDASRSARPRTSIMPNPVPRGTPHWVAAD